MKNIPSSTKLAIPLAAAIASTLTATVPAQPAGQTPALKPVESLWWVSTRRFPGTSESDAALSRVLKEWQPTGIFDAFILLKLPPTFADGQEFNRRASELIRDAGGRYIISTLPVGVEGWESCVNQRFAQKTIGTGGRYDASKAQPQAEWLNTLTNLQADTWAWVLEQPARMPTPEEAGRSAAEFVRIAKAHHKKAALWLSAQALTHGGGFERLTAAICQAGTNADYLTWMDLPGETLRNGESKWQETMAQLLDRILTLTPKEKTVMQWLPKPRWPTKDVAGTTAYLANCQAKGINRFCLLFSPQGFNQDSWSQFFRSLPKKPAAVK